MLSRPQLDRFEIDRYQDENGVFVQANWWIAKQMTRVEVETSIYHG
jgi:hypothetical protein